MTSENGNFMSLLFSKKTRSLLTLWASLFLRAFSIITILNRVLKGKQKAKKEMKGHQRKIERGLEQVVKNPLFQAFLTQLLALVVDYVGNALNKYLEQADKGE
jgi:uncharacterized membrane protein